MEASREHNDIIKLNEFFIDAKPSLSTNVTNSIYYNKLKHLLHSEIVYFCKEKTDLKNDLNILRMMVGEKLTEESVREYLNDLKEKYNADTNIGIEYHIEATRIDYGVPTFVIIRRGDNVSMKKFVFRFKKNSVSTSLDDVYISGTPKNIKDV